MISPTIEYKIKEYRFKDDFGQEADGCLFVIKPGGSIKVVKITDPEFKVKQVAVKGSGWILRINPEEEIECYEVGENVVVEEEYPSVYPMVKIGVIVGLPIPLGKG